MIRKASWQIDVSNFSALGFKASCCAQADDQVWLDCLERQICCQGSWNGSNIIHPMHPTLAYELNCFNIPAFDL